MFFQKWILKNGWNIVFLFLVFKNTFFYFKADCLIGNTQIARGETKLKSPCVKCTCTSEGTKCKVLF
jgi:hypothetical protein